MKNSGFLRAATCAVTLLLAAGAPLAAPAAPAAPAPPVEIPPDAQALIEAHVAWLGGWEALDGLRDLTLSGALETAGLSGTIEVSMRRDERQRVAYDLVVLEGVECLTGEAGWERNPSGQIEPMGEGKVMDERRVLARAFGRHLRGGGGVAAIAPVGEVVKDGRAWSALRFAYPGGDLHEILIDPASGESIWSRDVRDGQESWTRATDSRVVRGLRVAFRQETLHAHAAENQTVTWREVVLNAGLDDAVFARPDKGAQVAQLPEGLAVTDWLPMDLYQERYIFLRGELNGIATDIILDSGAGLTVLDRPLAEAAGLEASGSLPASGVGGRTEAAIVQGVTIRLGEMRIGPLSAAVIDLSGVNRRLGRDLPVILGKELFHALVVDVDYPRSRLRFHDPRSFAYDGPGRRLEVQAAEDGHRNVVLSVEGLAPAVFGLDTGSGSALTIFRAYAEQHDLLAGRQLSQRKSGGVGGETIEDIGTLDRIGIAGYELRGVPAGFHRQNVGGAFDTSRLAGNLGAGILARFRVVFDYGRGCLWLEPGPELAAPFPKDKTGLSFDRDAGALVVRFVAPGSPAAAAGWQEGERVVALDGAPVDADWWRTTLRWARAAAGATASLKMADGSERTLVLSEYY